MQRGLAVIVLAAFCAGCFAAQRTPDPNVLQSLRTIAIIPLEAAGPKYRFTPGGARVPVALPGQLGFILLPILIPVAIFVAADQVQRTAAIPETTLTAEAGPPSDSGMLTVELARAAVTILQRFSMPIAAHAADGYLRLPVTDTATSPAQVQFETDTRIRRWYNEDTANVDYSGLNTEGIDAILEVGISDYRYVDLGFVLQVHARLVNPATKAVLGRARNKYTPPFSLSWRPKPPGTPEQQYDLAVTKGSQLMLECLKDLGLLRNSK